MRSSCDFSLTFLTFVSLCLLLLSCFPHSSQDEPPNNRRIDGRFINLTMASYEEYTTAVQRSVMLYGDASQSQVRNLLLAPCSLLLSDGQVVTLLETRCKLLAPCCVLLAPCSLLPSNRVLQLAALDLREIATC